MKHTWSKSLLLLIVVFSMVPDSPALLSNSSTPGSLVDIKQVELVDASAFNAATVWLVGKEEGPGGVTQGVILEVSDGGRSRVRRYADPTSSFFEIRFVNDVGWVVGWKNDGTGLILRSKDSGRTWKSIPIRGDGPLFASQFIDANRGWVASKDGTILRTSDGGESWSASAISGATDLNSFDFSDSKNGWAVGGEGQVYRSTDGGVRWQARSAEFERLFRDLKPSNVDFRVIDFVNSQVGYIAAQVLVESDGTPVSETEKVFDYWGVVLKTEDGGQVWTLYVATRDLGLANAQFLGEAEAWIVPTWGWSDNVLLHSIDGGENWLPVNGPSQAGYPFSIFFVDPQNGWLLSENGMFFDHLFHTADGGRTWGRL